MVWDGLRPDSVTERDTPNLYRMARQGVRFDRHHSLFPTVTMVNAAAIATGASPGTNGLEGNLIDAIPPKRSDGRLYSVEESKSIMDLNAPDFYAGRLLALDTVSQEIEREGGYIAALGKKGPALIFDNRLMTVLGGKDETGEPHKDYLFFSDDVAAPQPAASKFTAAFPPEEKSGVIDGARDAYFTRLAIEDALPSAIRAADSGHPALIVLWQHNPDLTEHAAGLGTASSLEALALTDRNLGQLRTAIDSSGAGDRTDLIVVSDHGFATIRMRIDLGAMLVAAGIKHSADSTDIVVAPGGGADLVYLSPAAFPTRAAQRAVLQRIVNFAEAQEWCGPIFSRDAAESSVAATSRRAARGHHGGSSRASGPDLGWIDGTFSQAAAGLYNPARSPDLIISMREIPDADNRDFTGPSHPAFMIGANGEVSTPNHSEPLLHPVKGLVYEDSGASTRWSAGMGMHGAAGEREIHNFCAAIGPDFRRGFVDVNPTANTDIAPTIEQILGILPNAGPGGIAPTGRTMTEALEDGSHAAPPAHIQTLTTSLMLQGMDVISTIRVVHTAGESYLDGSSTERKPLGKSP